MLLPVLSFAQRDLAAAVSEVNGSEKGEVVKFPDEVLGYSAGYQSDEGGAVTIYHGGVKNIPNGANNNPVKAQINQSESYGLGLPASSLKYKVSRKPRKDQKKNTQETNFTRSARISNFK